MTEPDPPHNEPFAVPEIVVDGVFRDIRTEGESLRLVTFSRQAVPGMRDSQATASGRLIMTKKGAEQLADTIYGALNKTRPPHGRPARNRRRPG